MCPLLPVTISLRHTDRDPYPRSAGFDTDRHHAGDRTADKVLQSSFYWPTLFKDARKFVSSCDECQIIRNIYKRQEMPMNYSLAIEPFDVWGFDYMGPFPSSNGYDDPQV